METFGFTQARKELLGFAIDEQVSQQERLIELRGRLIEWAKADHAWQPDRPHTEDTIDAVIEGIAEDIVTLRVSVDMDAALWLEFARNGKWSWLFNVLVNHAGEIRTILSGEDPPTIVGDPVKNPDAQTEYEAAKAEMYAARR